MTTAADLLERFAATGAVTVDAAILQPAETLLDLYGEDIRARAYTTQDPLRGELMLRPDFTLPVVQWHMANGAEPARYTYAGPVFRRQEDNPDRPSEYTQVGLEIFDRSDPGAADADVFAAIVEATAGHGFRLQTGDMGLLAAAVDDLDTSAARKAALRRHIWRPHRFRTLIERFSRPAAKRPVAETDAPLVGLRSAAEIAARHAALDADSEVPPLSKEEVSRLDALLDVTGPARAAAETLADLAPAPAIARFTARLDALDARGIDTETLPFQTTFGRTLLEYYDGFVFGVLAQDGTPVATGGRYDALTRILGGGKAIPAVGGVIRPELLP